MRSRIVFAGAVLLVMFLGFSAHAKPDGSLGTNCVKCHGDSIPGDKPKDPPATPGDDGQTDPPATPGDDGQTDPPTTPGDDGQTDPR